MATVDVLIHPVRFRIVQALLDDRALTTAELAGALPDVPQPSLYRHLRRLLDAGVVEVVAERRVRGARERTYRLTGAGTSADAAEAAALGRDQLEQLFFAFLAGLAADFSAYLSVDGFDLGRDLVGFRTLALTLSDEETLELLQALSAAVAPFVDRPAAPERRRRSLSTVFLPTS